ncbi:MAG: fused response regulator/phosphatase [Gammaproteobacteria bacterium]|nr:fused response regulator/phosphatase [Gammaproteobacteria bacterium]
MPVTAVTKGKALVADDERSNRMILSAILKQIGYEVIQAENGVEAVELFQTEKPDIVLIDIIMPVMDGYDAVEQIKSDPDYSFTPVIFLTGMTDEQDLAKCIEVGGDDFLTKPFSRTLLTAKIHAMERISNLHQQVNVLYARTQQDQEMAKEVFAGAVITDNVALNAIHTLSQPAELFSGDVLLSAYSPSGDLNVMMGDFTGHGLAAALGAMPASEVFRAMTSKGYSIQQTLSGINSKLLNILPTNMFLAIQFITVAKSLDYVSVCNCGMPDILFLDADNHTIKHRTPSFGIPLGIAADIDFNECVELVKVDLGETILLASDGVTEALNDNNEHFTKNRLEAAISDRHADESTIDSVSRALQLFCGDASQADDISLAEVPCTPEILQTIECETVDNQYETQPTTGFNCNNNVNRVNFSVSLHGRRLSDADPIPMLINHIHEIEGLAEHRRLLFTILTELYTNALDHGVLDLSSDIKNEMDGFSNYFTEREKRLEQLTEGYVTISVSSCTTLDGGEMVITIKDSGSGFDFADYQCDKTDYSRLSGRGIQLITGLCSSVTYVEPGNHVEAVYSWSDA